MFKPLLKVSFQALLIGVAFILGKATFAQSLEIKVWPADKIYTYTVAEPWLHDIVLQNVVTINRSSHAVNMEKLEIGVLRNGRVMQQRVIDLNALEGNLKSFSAKYKSGALNIWDGEYHLKDFFADAKLAESVRLGPNEGISIRDQYFAFNDQVDTVQVTIFGKSEDGSVVQASVKLPLESYQSKTNLYLPLVGTWQVANGPFPYVSHRWIIHQEFAYDFWKIDGNGADHRGDGGRYEDYYSYGQPVIAPADALVYEVREGRNDAPLINDQIIKDQAEVVKRLTAYRDMLFQKGDYQELGGNQVILDHGNGEFSVLAHLRKGSILVKKGDQVKRGDVLAQVGSSGLSNVPHLHYELVSSPDIPKRRGLPLRFTNINGESGSRLLSFGEFVKNRTTAK